jgi:hypothetical protein
MLARPSWLLSIGISLSNCSEMLLGILADPSVGTEYVIRLPLLLVTVISGAKDEEYNLKYNNKRIDSKWSQLS